MSFWIDVSAETDEERVAAWQRQLEPLVADVFATYSAGFHGDYSPGSLAELEQFVLAALPDLDGMKQPTTLPVVKAAVGYLGETLLRARGGEWVWGQGELAGMPYVALDEERARLAPLEYIIEAVRVRDGKQFTQLWSRVEAGEPAADSSDLLLTLVVAIVQDHGYSCTIESDTVMLSGSGVSDWELSLDNLRRKVAPEPEDQWPALVADHLSTMFAELDVTATAPLDMADLDRIRPLLRARMYPEDMEDVGIPVVSRTLAPGLAQRVVIDQVNTMVSVTYDRLSHWRIQEQDLFEIAEDNTHDDGLLTVEDLEVEDERILGLYGSADYASAHARWLGEYPVVGRWGAAFVVPCEGTVFIHPLDGMDAYVSVGTLANMAMVTHAERPSPVSPSVYWWHDGIIELAADVRKSGDELELHVSAEFQEVMEQIAEYADGTS
ncbi:hypothetical protein ACFQZZ_07940 [Nocardia sp. GCM10030253]|uniref:hypothetical protein n=1 Tax=Nocardia sp. GCM10030253 TaxID=3273404 RepID=UPI0036382BD8